MKLRLPVTTMLGISAEIIYAFSIMLIGFVICIIVSFKI
jgi:hypothetical protein